MGFIDIKECIFTGEKAHAIINDIAAVEYFVAVNGKRHLIRYSRIDEDDHFFIDNKDKFFGLLYNDDWFEDEKVLITIDELQKLLERKSFPAAPEDKLERLFLTLFNRQEEDGKFIIMPKDYYDTILWKILYFKSLDEMHYYVLVLMHKKLISPELEGFNFSGMKGYRITYEGLNYQLKLTSEGDKSNKCFIAMSFNSDMVNIRNAIKDAVVSTGFIPILVDELDIDSDKTINDEIIASLKRCKFCIADFTGHSNGVYFESGFALGQGKKVIYTCRIDAFENRHFDIKPLQHIIYQTADELKKALINKIDAWIK